jgi:hypothetical protein
MATGTGTPSTTALGTELSRVSIASTGSLTRVLAVVTAIANWAAGIGTGTITEAGIFSAASGNDSTHPMYVSASFGAITKNAGDTLQITWTITLI